MSQPADADFILKVHVPNIRAYDRLLNEVLFRIPGMKHVKSSFTLREVKYDTALPLPAAETEDRMVRIRTRAPGAGNDGAPPNSPWATASSAPLSIRT